MQLGVNVPDFGPGTDPGVLRDWARITEELGYGLLMVSDHVVVTPDVATRYPEPFYEPFTTLSWLAGVTSRVRLGTSVPFAARGRLTDEYLAALRDTWRTDIEDGAAPIPVWVGGHSAAALRRATRFGDAWHPLRLSLPRMRAVLKDHSLPGFAPRITLKLTTTPVDGPERPAGVGTIEQVLDDLGQLRLLGADTVVLDPYHGDPRETVRPETAWQALTEVATHWRTAS